MKDRLNELQGLVAELEPEFVWRLRHDYGSPEFDLVVSTLSDARAEIDHILNRADRFKKVQQITKVAMDCIRDGMNPRDAGEMWTERVRAVVKGKCDTAFMLRRAK